MGPIESEATTSDDGRWAAVERRDHQSDGRFVYAVRTTGVYCRPACSSRRPNRSNVRFFDDPEGAERAGFRPCKRCEPGKPAADRRLPSVIAAACETLRDAESPPRLADLAIEAGLSPGQFHRTFKRAVGLTPRDYALSIRSSKLRDALPGSGSVVGAILEAGYGSVARAYDEAPEELGMTPAAYRKGGPGLPIHHAAAESALGWVVVAWTEVGLCSIELGDSREELEARLRGRFPGALPATDDADRLRRVVAEVERPGSGDGLGLPLDVRGTAFQRRVWDRLRTIPRGSTASYSEVARSIGMPNAARAVAGACASNALAVVIPCHRVVRGDGGLGGYRWGVGRKRALLDAESGARSGREAVPPGPEAD